MSSYHDLVSALRHLIEDTLQQQYQYYKGVLGDGFGNVDIPDREGFSFVRIGGKTLQIFNKAVRQGEGTPVIVGTLPWMPDRRQVLSVDWEAYLDIGWDSEFGGSTQHGATHEWRDGGEPGSDTFNIYRRQMFPLRCEPLGSGSTSVIVNPYGFSDDQGAFRSWPGTPGIDLSSIVPSATGTARFALVYWDYTDNDFYGSLNAVTGTLTPVSGAVLPVRPMPPIGTILSSAWVKLQGGQSTITEADIYDARPILNTVGTLTVEDTLSYYTGTPLSAQVMFDQIASVLVNGGPKVSELWSENLQTKVADVNNSLDINASSADLLINSIITGGVTSTGNIAIGFTSDGDFFNTLKDGPSGGSGVYERINYWQTPDTHFNGFSGFTWASYTGFGTPATINTSIYPSIAWIYNTALRAFAYLGSYDDNIYARIATLQGVRSGLRMDDGTNNNYAELFLAESGGTVSLIYRYAVGGSVTGPTTLASGFPPQFFVLRLRRTGDNVSFYYSIDLPRTVYAGTQVTITGWTPIREGIYHEYVSGTSADPERGTMVDWIFTE